MKIVILDGHTVNPGDLDWKPLEKIGDVAVYPRTSSDQVLERSMDAEIIITSKVIIDKDIINKLPKLRYVGVIATGFNVVDIEAARQKNIVVTNVAAYSTSSVVQLVFAHILELARRVGHHDQSVKSGQWSKASDFCYWDFPQVGLDKKALGIIGFGNIGQSVAAVGSSFGMKIIAHDNFIDKSKHSDVEFVELDSIFKRSDFLSIHCPLTDETKNLINKDNLIKMKKTAYLINTSRGPVVNELDLAWALNTGEIAGAGLDVLQVEPPGDNPLFKAKNCYITPHIGWACFEARSLLIELTASNVDAFLAGDPINVVN
ncbi:MAG: D-2-hydroxyacid dehydrogenase [Bacteriovoracaceae bacterium]|nr:D-2-hydroxyacid dehydrogenase [Bacteriovoracaceae bacterium]